MEAVLCARAEINSQLHTAHHVLHEYRIDGQTCCLVLHVLLERVSDRRAIAKVDWIVEIFAFLLLLGFKG